MDRLADPGAADWLALTDGTIDVAEVFQWVCQPSCGGVVLFCGTVRDHAEGRAGVTSLTYEAYEEEVVPRLQAVAAGARRRWADLGRLALLHRVGTLGVGEVSVVVAASAPHRAEAFDAARYAIDAVKSTVPIWKREVWAGGEDWSACDHPVTEVAS